MKVISSKEYATRIGDCIDSSIEDAIQSAYDEIADIYRFERVSHQDLFDAFYEGAAGEIRDAVIRLFEECGMDVRPDGKDW